MADYDNMLIIGDLNSCMTETPMKNFCELYDLENLIKQPTCYKNADNPSSIDVLLTNRKNSFQNSMTIETGLSDHHKMIITVLKSYCKKREPIKRTYRSYKRFDWPNLRNVLKQNECMNYEDFHEIFMKVLDKHAPQKTKLVSANNGPFMTSKEMMHRSRLRNNFNKNPTEENEKLYKKQRNFSVSLLKREKKNYYNNIDLKIFEDNKKFWRSIKPLFSNKQKYLDRNITIMEDDKIFSENPVAEKLNNYSSWLLKV